MTISQEFEHELDVFRKEAEGSAQFFYAYLTLHAVAGEERQVYRALNRTPLFWNTNLAALQAATIISLGRIFDQQSPHNIDQLLKLAQDNPQLFSKASLGIRKQGTASAPPKWLDEYLAAVYEPTKDDFRRLRGHVKKKRRVYESNYRDLRRKVFAHLEITERSKVDALFHKTNIRELQRMFAFLGAFHEALWQLFFNGRKPLLRPQRYSIARIRDLPSPATRRQSVQERIVHEAESMVRHLACVAQPCRQPDLGC
ncbi:MAG: hypothetical protein KGL63_00955 [Betaproteobacteria bacterium]|nr:hypothetical protein [Betaproteobacteria bacterium]